MPAPSTIDEFLDLVRKSGVVDEKRLSSQLTRLSSNGPLPTVPLDLARLLVAEGVLTRFQAEQFLQGKWRRFTLGKYRVLERLGSGGMGSVYLCEHVLMRRRVAVKVLPNKKDGAETSARDRFIREARAVAALDHPNIVRAYDIDVEEDLHFLVMEHVDGASLQEMVKRYPNGIDSLRACHYIRQSALGLQHAHEKAGIVHRDIKPANILVDRNGIVKVLDMGLARFFHDEDDLLTKEYDEKVLGTADYLAPEQALDSHTVDIRADIYSLGATFYFCLTGKPPFAEGSVAQKLIWHHTRAPRPIRSLRSDVPDEIIAIVERMMAKDKSVRYQSPQEVADALAPLTQVPIPPPPESEMPQLSLAATRVLTPGGEASLTGPRTNEAGSKRNWTISGQGSSSTTANDSPPVIVTPPPRSAPPPPPSMPMSIPTTPQPQATPVPQPPPPPPSPPSPKPAPAPTAAPVKERPPAPPVAPAPIAAPMMELPPAAPPAQPAQPVPVVVQAPPAVPAQATAAPQLPEAETVEEEEPFAAPFVPGASIRPRTPRSPAEEGPPSRLGLWIGVGIGGVLVAIAVGIVLMLFLFPEKPKEKPPPPPRKPLRVTPQTSGGLSQVLRSAQDGDRIIIEVDIREADVFIRRKNLTIEGAPGKTITWKAPEKLDPVAKLVTIDNRSNVVFRNIRFEGDNKPMALLQVYGACDGLKLENVELLGVRQYGMLMVNAAGTADNPILFQGVRITTTQPTQSAVHFLVVPEHKTVPRSDHIVFRDCTFPGLGQKFTRRTDGDIGTNVEFPPGLSPVTLPQKNP